MATEERPPEPAPNSNEGVDLRKGLREGAGREESMLATETVELLRTWGVYVLLAASLVMGVYAFYNWRTREREKNYDQAFQDVEAARVAGKPDGLVSAASSHSGVGAAPLLAKINAADVHLSASRTGVPIGETVNADGALAAGKEFLTVEQRTQESARAEKLYSEVVASANSTSGQRVLAIGALTGLASIAEDRGDLDQARTHYTKAKDIATASKFTTKAELLQKRVDTLDKLKTAPRLLAQAEVPGAAPVTPTTIPMGGVVGRTADGREVPLGGDTLQAQPITITSEGVKPALPTVTPVPAPAPTPAPTPAPEAPKNP